MMPAECSRRWFLRATGSALLVACSNAASHRPQQASVIVANHPLYIDAETNRGFTAATGISVEYHEEINDDGAWLAGVTPQLQRGESIDRDVVIVSDWVAARLASRGWLAGGEQIVWAIGMIGIAYDAKRVGGDIARIADLFQPALHGRVALPNDMRLALGTALLADETDPSTVTLEQATATAARLANSMRLGQITLVPRPIERLESGDTDVAVVRASDTVGLEAGHPDIRFVVPEEGGLLLTDVAVLLARAPNLQGGQRYLAYVDEPSHASERFRVVPALWPSDPMHGPLDTQLRAIAPDVVNDPRRNPPVDVRARLRPFRILSESDDMAFVRLFDGVVHANR